MVMVLPVMLRLLHHPLAYKSLLPLGWRQGLIGVGLTIPGMVGVGIIQDTDGGIVSLLRPMSKALSTVEHSADFIFLAKLCQ